MKLEKIEIFRVKMPLIAPFRTAFGNDAEIESVLVRLESEGVSGWGEAAPWTRPAYSPEHAAGVFATVRDHFAPSLLGQDIDSGEALQQALSWAKGNRFAKAALDTAWWDLQANRQGVPLWQLIGGDSGIVEVGADFGVLETIDELLEQIDSAMDQGFKRVKLKMRPGWELNMLDAVRSEFPDTIFHVDCNSAYTLDDVELMRALDDYDLAMIEQPLMHDDLIDHATLQRQLQTPICLDESITSAVKARQAIECGACGWINIKPGRVGGITEALAIHRVCSANNLPVWIGGMLESAIGSNICLALATLPMVNYPCDIFPSGRFYRQDLAQPELRLAAPSVVHAQERPGHGTRPHAERLERQTVTHALLEQHAG